MSKTKIVPNFVQEGLKCWNALIYRLNTPHIGISKYIVCSEVSALRHYVQDESDWFCFRRCVENEKQECNAVRDLV